MRGWVYVMTNKSMPGLVKIGFSTKDPHLRADELNGTWCPHPFVVAYDALVEDPRVVEQAAHRELSPNHEAKEYFRVSVDAAIQVLRQVLSKQGKSTLLERGAHRSQDPTESPDNKARKAIVNRQPTPPGNGVNRTSLFIGNCGYCRNEFRLTLTRHDSAAVCPHCFRRNDVSDFLRQAFPF